MKKNLIYLLILAVLAVVAYFALNREKEIFTKEDANFKVENTEAVTKVFLSDPGVGNIKLTKDDVGVWIVNDSFRARQDWVEYLLEGMGEANTIQMVPKTAHNNTVKLLASNSVKVEVYKGDDKTNSYFVGKEPNNDNLSYFLNIRTDGKNAPRPFLVKCGHSGTFLGVRYRTDLEYWRDKQIMYFPKKKIKNITVDYPSKPEASFSVSLSPLQVMPNENSIVINDIRLEKYVSFYSKLFCSGYENNYALKDTFLSAFKPFAKVKISSTEGEEHKVDIYYQQVNKTTHSIITIDGKEYDGDSFLGWYDDRDLILLSSETAQKVLRERQEFFKLPSKN